AMLGPDARASSQLRMLRSGSAARLAGCPYLLVRVHLLPELRGRDSCRTLSELWRRAGSPADPPCGNAGQTSCLDNAQVEAAGLHRGRLIGGPMRGIPAP